MGNSVLRNSAYAVKEEVTEGTYVPPAADNEYMQVIPDGTELTPSKELLERQVLTGSVGKATSRTGIKSSAGSLVAELRGSDTEGGAPEFEALMKSALGSVRSSAAITIDDADSGGTHTTSRAYLPDADASKIEIGDMVTIQVAGDYHTSPVSAKSDTPGDVFIDLLIPADGAFLDADVIAAFRTYVPADAGHPSLSVSKWIEDSVLEQYTGMKVTSLSMDSFTTGQLASFNFGMEGLGFDRAVSAIPHTPVPQSALPSIILSACVYQDGVLLPVNEVGMSLENTLGFVTSTCSPNGRTSSRVTERVVSGTIDPFKQDDSVAQFDKFDLNTEFSLFGFAIIPGAVGEYSEVVSFYMPNCLAVELGESDSDGLLQDAISFNATRGPNGSSDELFIGIS